MHNGAPLKPLFWIYVPFIQFSFLPIRNVMRKHGETIQSALEVSSSMSVSPWAESESGTLGEEGKYQLEEKGGQYRKNLIEQHRRSSTQEDIVMGFRKLSLLQRESLCNSILANLAYSYLCSIQQQLSSGKDRRRENCRSEQRAAGN